MNTLVPIVLVQFQLVGWFTNHFQHLLTWQNHSDRTGASIWQKLMSKLSLSSLQVIPNFWLYYFYWLSPQKWQIKLLLLWELVSKSDKKATTSLKVSLKKWQKIYYHIIPQTRRPLIQDYLEYKPMKKVKKILCYLVQSWV